jgi:hypothetical protein
LEYRARYGNMHFGEHNPVQNLPYHMYEAAE